jgi:hypothetical protein
MGMKLKGEDLTITMKLKKPKPSNSGKSLLVASTRGVKKSGVIVRGKPVRFTASAFIYVETKRSSRSQKKSAKTRKRDGRK